MKKEISRAVSGLLAGLMVIAMLPAAAFAVEDAVLISTADQLFEFADDVNGGNTYEGKTVKLTADINLGGETAPWTPIGLFSGTFDGEGHVISGLYINGTASNQALFSSISGSALIKNLVVQGDIISSGGTLAGIVAVNNGTIENCASNVNITATGGNFVHFCGGITADNSGTVTDCCFTGIIVKDGGSAIGGLVGRNFSGTVTDCYNTGSVSSSAGSHVGGVIGQSRGSTTVCNLYNVGKIAGQTNVGAVIGQDQNSSGTSNLYYLSGSAEFGVGSTEDVTGCMSEADMKNGTLLSKLGSAFKSDDDGINGGYPVLKWQSVVPDVIIGTYEQFYAFADSVNGGHSYAGKRIKLDVNIDLGGKNNPWTPIGSASSPFEGIFDGGYHVISGVYIDSGSDAGLFGRVKNGTVKNLVADGEVAGTSNIAGVVGYLDNGDILNCGNRAKVTGGSAVGGVVGYVNGDCTVESCFNTGSVVGTTGYIGGVTGQHWRAGVVENCYNIGTVTGPATVGGVTGGHKACSAELINCYNAGAVGEGTNNVGAVIGATRGDVVNCYFLKGTGSDNNGCIEVENADAFDPNTIGAAFVAGDVYPALIWEEKISAAKPVLPGFTEMTERSRELADLIRAAVNSAKSHGNVGSGTLLGSEAFLNGASSTDTDWMALAMARFGYYDVRNEYQYLIDDGSGYDDYLAAMRAYIEKTYADNNGILHSAKATEWHRAVLAIKALGGDPTRFGSYNGSPIDLIADGSYNCALNGGPGKQGINGWIFGLISMDTGMFDVPENALYSRETFITEILKLQLSDGVGGNSYGGWVLSGAYGMKSDIDITAMAIQALAPYYNDSTVYTYINTGSKEQRSVTVRRCVDEALDVLSSRMDTNGGFSSWGSTNSEGISQVLVALCSLGIDPASDARFVTSDGKTLLDGILQFRLQDGGFCHILGGGWNSMANDQATYALVSYWRFENEMRALYDMRGNFTDEQTDAIKNAEAAIDRLPDPSADNYKELIKEALDAWKAVPVGERRYVNNYSSLAAALDLIGGEDKLNTSDPYTVRIEITKQPNKLQYFEGDLFDPAGMEVTATFSDGTARAVNEYRYSPTSELTTEDQTVTVVYGVLKTSVSITVEEKLPWEGSGTEEDPYLIGTEEELTDFAEYINKGENFANKTAVLTANLDLSDILWTPIGKSQRLAFAGTFDGQGFCIDNLYSSLGGLFGYAADSAVIRNVGVASGEIGSDSGYSSFFGGILGWSDGADVINCWNGADIYCSSYSGGVVGTVRDGESVISGCFNRGNIIGHESSTHLGGIVGHLDTGYPVTVEDCYNTGDITGGYSVGGIVGAMQDGPHTVILCYNVGTVEAVTSNPNMSGRAGAVVGDSTRKENTVRDCYYLVGSCENGGINKDAGIEDTTVSLSKMQFKDGTLLSALGDAFKEDRYELVNGGYPILSWQSTEDADAVDEVISLIDSIGEVTLEREDAIRAARAAYDALDDETLRALVSNYDTLTEAEKTLQDLKDAAEPSDTDEPSEPGETDKPDDPGEPGETTDSGNDPGGDVPPQTGDPENLTFSILLMLISGTAVVLLSSVEKTKKKR